MKCRVCGKEINFVILDGRQSAVHRRAVGANLKIINPSAGHQRKLRQQLEQECRKNLSSAPVGEEVEPEFVDDVRSVQDATADEFKASEA